MSFFKNSFSKTVRSVLFGPARQTALGRAQTQRQMQASTPEPVRGISAGGLYGLLAGGERQSSHW